MVESVNKFCLSKLSGVNEIAGFIDLLSSWVGLSVSGAYDFILKVKAFLALL